MRTAECMDPLPVGKQDSFLSIHSHSSITHRLSSTESTRNPGNVQLLPSQCRHHLTIALSLWTGNRRPWPLVARAPHLPSHTCTPQT